MKKLAAAIFAVLTAFALGAPVAHAAQTSDVYVTHGEKAQLTTVAWRRHHHRRHRRHH